MKMKEGDRLTDIAGEVRHKTMSALLIFDGKITDWVPMSLVEDNHDGTFTMPEWLAKEKGFI